MESGQGRQGKDVPPRRGHPRDTGALLLLCYYNNIAILLQSSLGVSPSTPTEIKTSPFSVDTVPVPPTTCLLIPIPGSGSVTLDMK